MNPPKKTDQLLADERFQDDLMSFETFSEEKKKETSEKYGISMKEFLDAKKFLSGLSFKKEELITADDTSYALKKLMGEIVVKKIICKKERTVRFIRIISGVAAVLFIPLLLTTIHFYRISRNTESVYYSSNITTKTFNTFQASRGAKTQLVLPDGSRVWLNSGSSLTCPVRFDSESRNVELNGEAYFEVIKNPRVPMVVSSGNLKVKVYGTKFNVNAFADNGMIETTLVEGKVTIIPGKSKKEYLLEPGYTASYSIRNEKLQIVRVDDMDAYTGWKDGILLFNNERFADIVKKLERWYNVNIELTNKSLGDYILYATFIDENIEQVLDIFSNSIPISMEYPKRIKQPDGSYSKQMIIIKPTSKEK